MKCPQSDQHFRYSKDGDRWEFADCLKEECAWWDNTHGICAVLQLSKAIYYMGLHIAQAEKKMPHEGQFREGQFRK